MQLESLGDARKDVMRNRHLFQHFLALRPLWYLHAQASLPQMVVGTVPTIPNLVKSLRA